MAALTMADFHLEWYKFISKINSFQIKIYIVVLTLFFYLVGCGQNTPGKFWSYVKCESVQIFNTIQ